MKIKIGDYEHYKGKRYCVIGVAKHSETLDDLVVYECLHENKLSKLWVRPLKMSVEKITVGGKKVSRFKYLGKN